MPTETITIEVDLETARAFRAAGDDKRRCWSLLLELRLTAQAANVVGSHGRHVRAGTTEWTDAENFGVDLE